MAPARQLGWLLNTISIQYCVYWDTRHNKYLAYKI
jgi:hypothetical protein